MRHIRWQPWMVPRNEAEAIRSIEYYRGAVQRDLAVRRGLTPRTQPSWTGSTSQRASAAIADLSREPSAAPASPEYKPATAIVDFAGGSPSGHVSADTAVPTPISATTYQKLSPTRNPPFGAMPKKTVQTTMIAVANDSPLDCFCGSGIAEPGSGGQDVGRADKSTA